MRTVQLDRLRRWLPARPEDGATALVVGLHWTRWLHFWVGAPALVATTLAAFSSCRSLGLLGGWAEPATWVVASLVGAVVLKVTALWWRALSATCVVVTPANLYRSRVEKLFWRVVDPVPIAGGRFESHVEGWGLLGVRTVLFTLEGDIPEVELRHSNLGADGMRRLHLLTRPGGRATGPLNDS